jgi:PAS domain S-box-containing protein
MAEGDKFDVASVVGGGGVLSSGGGHSVSGVGPAVSGGVGWWGRWAWVPLPVLLVSILVLWAAKPSFVYESAGLVLVLNIPFTLSTGALIAFLAGRSFASSGAMGTLLLGCGALFWAAAAVVAVLAGGFGADFNHQVTVHNACAWLSAGCHFGGVLLSRGTARGRGAAGLWLVVGYALTGGVVALVVVATVAGWVPAFFVQGEGGTPLRQSVLGSAVAMFGTTAWLLARGPGPVSAFARWYSLALGLAAVGVFGVMLETAAGSLLNWTGRLAQVLSGVYMLAAAVLSVREVGGWRISLEQALRENKERLAAFAAATFEGIVESEGGRIVDCNEVFAGMAGRTVSELRGMTIQDLVVPEDRERVMGNIRRNCESVVEHGVLRKDGKRLVVEARARPGTLEAGRRFTVVRDITQRKETEQALEAEHRALESQRNVLQAVMNGASKVHLVYLDRDFNFVRVNEAYAQTCGYRPEEMVGKNHFVLYPQAENEAIFRRVRDTGETAAYHDKPFEFPDHPERGVTYWDWTLSAVKDAAGAVVGLVFALVETTARKRAEEAVRRKGEELEEAQRLAHIGSWYWDARTDITIGSNELLRIYGFEPGKESMPDFKQQRGRCYPVDEWERLNAAVRRTLETGIGYELDVRALRKDSDIWLTTRSEVVRDSQNQVIGLRGTVQDITERKRAEEALAGSERLYRAVGESINYGIWVCDAQGRNIYASDSFLKLVGITQEQCSDFGWGELLHPEDTEATIAAWKQCVQSGGPWYREHRFRGADGQWHPVLACGVAVRNERAEITRWAGINLDISRLKQTEGDLRNAKDELAKTNANLERLVADRTAKLEELVGELEHFSYTITHDMRAPLRGMQGFAEMLAETCADCAQQDAQGFLKRIQTSATRMDRLITDALNYNKAVRQELTLEPVDVGALLRGMVDSYPELQRSRARIEIEGQMPLVMGNEAGLTQCFSNLLGNAVKFVKPGEKPEIRIWGEVLAEGENRDGEGAGWVRLWVEDKGIGIPEAMLPRAFDMFARGQTTYEGTGIGLALVRKVAHRMGGKVGVQSEEGKGSRFWIELRPGDLRRAK